MKASTLVNIKFGLIDLSYFEMKAPFNLSLTMCYTYKKTDSQTNLMIELN